MGAPDVKQWDVFLSHAAEDKQTVALPLTEALRRNGVRVWLDKFQIEIGDSIRQKVDQGLVNSRFGVVVLSVPFLTKHWTGSELDALWALDAVLPVWHGIDKEMLKQYSPLLAGRASISTSEGMDAVAQAIASRVFKVDNGAGKDAPQVAREFAVLLGRGAPEPELVAFVTDHANILTRALGLDIDSRDLFRTRLQLGPHVVDFCTATYQPSVTRMMDHEFVLFGPAVTPLFDNGRPAPGLNAALERAQAFRLWLGSNVALAREQVRDVRPQASIKVVVGRRPQPDSEGSRGLQELNDDLINIQVRTYDWLLDSALAIAERSAR